MTLEEIKEKYCPEVKKMFPKGDVKVQYMINKFFIRRDIDLYKIAEDFIYRVEVLPSFYLSSEIILV